LNSKDLSSHEKKKKKKLPRVIITCALYTASFSNKYIKFSQFLLFIIFHDDLNCASNSASNCDLEVEFERFNTVVFLSKDISFKKRKSWVIAHNN
jgi:hypothetical protein